MGYDMSLSRSRTWYMLSMRYSVKKLCEISIFKI